MHCDSFDSTDSFGYNREVRSGVELLRIENRPVQRKVQITRYIRQSPQSRYQPTVFKESTMTTEAIPVDRPVYKGLRRFNAIMGFLHLVQGVFMIVASNDTTYPIWTNFLSFNVDTLSLAPQPELLYELRFGPAVAMFLLISAVAHFYLSTIGYNRYVRDLEMKMNPTRFYEYALSSSLMIVLIGMLVGLWDLGALILIFGINATMNLFGIMMELHNQHTQKG